MTDPQLLQAQIAQGHRAEEELLAQLENSLLVTPPAKVPDPPVTPPVVTSPTDPPVLPTVPANPTPSTSPDLAPLVIARLEPNHNSVKIFITPVPGAMDYRAYGQDDPHFVKYAGGAGMSASRGVSDWTPQRGEIVPTFEPSCIEINGLVPGSHTVWIVEAVDRLGPYMDPMAQGLPMPVCTRSSCGGVLDPLCDDTIHGNGHGTPGSFPLPIARGTVSLSPQARSLSGESVFFDTFDEDASFVRVAPDPRTVALDPQNCVRFESPKWVADVYHAGDRVDELKVFTDHRHLMTVLADGGKTWNHGPNNEPIFAGGQAYASFTLRPKASLDIGGGKCAHITGEWDSHNSGRRWQDVFIAPAGDVIVQNAWSEVVLNPMASKNCVAVGMRVNVVQVRQFDISGTNPGVMTPQGTLTFERFVGQTPDAVNGCPRPAFRCTALQPGTAQIGHNGFDNGHDNDIDNRHRWDIYLTTTRIQVYEEGTLKVDWTFPVPLVYTKFDVWFMHHLYHSNLENTELHTNYVEPELLWRDHTPYTDQRHWDNLGFEVLHSWPFDSPSRQNPA